MKLILEPEEGYEMGKLIVKDENGQIIKVNKNTDAPYAPKKPSTLGSRIKRCGLM